MQDFKRDIPTSHEIPATHEAMVWGYIDAATPPILRVASGDIVTLHSFPAGGAEILPERREMVPDAYREAIEALPRGPGPHFITGPVYVEDAAPGDGHRYVARHRERDDVTDFECEQLDEADFRAGKHRSYRQAHAADVAVVFEQ